MKRPDAGGGWASIRYSLGAAGRVGPLRLLRAMRTRNACKTCALGMGGQRGGMRNELGRFPEVCKKSLQAMAADLQPAIPAAFFEERDIDALRAMTSRELEHAGRLVTPMRAAPGARRYTPVTWDEAMATIAARLRSAPPEETFFYASGRSSNEAGFLLQLLARCLGTNNVSNCSYYCHQASGAGLRGSLGTGTATLGVEDIERADLVVLIGGNPASNHPRLMTHLVRVRERGGSIVVVNPVRETGLVRFRVPSDPRSLLFGSEVASLYVQPHIGGDIALLVGVAKVIVEQSATSAEFIATHTEGWEAVRGVIETTTWQEIETESGVPRSVIEQLADAYAASERTIFAWTMGITHHTHGVENVQWIANLALMRGMVGKPGAGLLPIRGHSNVQGMGTIGVTPALESAIEARFADHGIPVPTHAGLDTMGCMERAAAGWMRVAIALGGNLFGSNPDARFASSAMGQVDTVVYLSTTLNTGHAHGRGKDTFILPVLARDEEPYRTTQESMFSYVRLSDGGTARHTGPRGEVHVLAELAGKALESGRSPVDWTAFTDADAVRGWIAALVPSMARVAHVGSTKEEFHIPGRVLHDPRFALPGGRARFHAHRIPESGRTAREPANYVLRLMTVRSEGQFNTVVYEEEDLYRGQERRDVVMMHPTDLARLGITPETRVRVISDTGELTVLARPFDIRAGNALMYYPEANAITSRAVDPKSKTPAFKAVSVRIVPAGA